MNFRRYKKFIVYVVVSWMACCLMIFTAAYGQTEQELYTANQELTSIHEEANFVSLKEVLENIEKSHNISFFYDWKLIDNKMLHQSVLNADSLSTELAGVLAEFNLTYKQHTNSTYLIVEQDNPDPKHITSCKKIRQIR